MPGESFTVISDKSRYSLAQFLNLQKPDLALMLLMKHEAAKSIEDDLSGLGRACLEMDESRLIELIEEIAATSGDLRDRVTPRYRFDQRYDELQRCLDADGIQINGSIVFVRDKVIDPFVGTGDLLRSGRPVDLVVSNPPFADALAGNSELGSYYDLGSVAGPVTNSVDLGGLPDPNGAKPREFVLNANQISLETRGAGQIDLVLRGPEMAKLTLPLSDQMIIAVEEKLREALQFVRSPREHEAPPLGTSAGAEVDYDEIHASLNRVRSVIEAVSDLRNSGIGHNNPPEPIDPPPLSVEDIDICIQAVNVYRTTTSADADEARTLLRTVVATVEKRTLACKEWLGRQSADFISTIDTNCGKLFAEGLVRGFGTATAGGVLGGAALLLAALLRALS